MPPFYDDTPGYEPGAFFFWPPAAQPDNLLEILAPRVEVRREQFQRIAAKATANCRFTTDKARETLRRL